MTENLKISETFAKALIKAQSLMEDPKKDSENPYFKSKYADLSSVRKSCLPQLNSNGIAVLQATTKISEKSVVKTILIHESGEILDIGCDTEILFGKPNDPQAQGSGITYARRYGLQTLLSLAAEDDDGNKGAEKDKTSPESKFTKKPEGAMAGLADQANENIKSSAEEKRLAQLKQSLSELGSVAEIDGYLSQIPPRGKISRLEMLKGMSPINAAEADSIVRMAKLAIDPEGKYE